MIILSKAKLYRNIFPYRFISKENKENLRKIKETVFNIIKDKKILKDIEIIENPVNLKKVLLFNQIIDDEDILTKQSMIIKEKDEDIYIMLNISEHILISLIRYGEKFSEIINNVNKIEEKLKKFFIFSYSKNFGFLGRELLLCPYQLKIKLIFHLPAVYYTNKITELSSNLRISGIEIKGINQHKNYSYGFVEVFIKPDTNESIEDFIKRIKSFVEIIENFEKNSSISYIKKNRIKFEDMVFKSYGILKYSKIVEYEEFLSEISKILWGNYNEVIKINNEKIFKFILNQGDLINDKKGSFKRALVICKKLLTHS